MRFRFTIRDLLWLTLVVAMAAGWWIDHRADRYRPWIIRKYDDGTFTMTNTNTGVVYDLEGDYPRSPTFSRPTPSD